MPRRPVVPRGVTLAGRRRRTSFSELLSDKWGAVRDLLLILEAGAVTSTLGAMKRTLTGDSELLALVSE